MAGLPVHNPALEVETVGFRRWADHWLGIVVAPWCMSLLLLPGSSGTWITAPENQRVFHRFPAGDLAFLGSDEPEISEYQSCSLFSPMTQFSAQSDDAYRYGIDLYNFAYWWECHEVFEGFWHAVGPNTEQGQFFQALIQLAAGNLKRFMKNEIAARSLLRKSLRRFAELPDCYMGIDLAELRNKLGETPTPDLSGTFLLTLECASNRSPQT